MISIAYRRCPVLNDDLIFSDGERDILVIRQNGSFFSGKELFGTDLGMATNLRHSLQHATIENRREESACTLVGLFPNPFASDESRRAWGLKVEEINAELIAAEEAARKSKIDEARRQAYKDSLRPLAEAAFHNPAVPHIAKTDDVPVAGDKTVVNLPVTKQR